MECRYFVGMLIRQVRAEDVREEMVKAIPLSLVVQRDDEEVGAFQGFQDALLSSRPVTALQREPFSRSRIEVWSRKVRIWAGWRRKTSSTR